MSRLSPHSLSPHSLSPHSPRVKFDISVVVGEKAAWLRQEFRLPPGFGLVIPVGTVPEVLMHYGLGNNERKARRFQNPWLVSIYKWMHGQMAMHAVDKLELQQYLDRKTTAKDYTMVEKFIPLPPTARNQAVGA